MLNNQTINKLHDMRLTAMAQSFLEQMDTSQFSELSFEDRFGLIVDAEWSRRKNNHLAHSSSRLRCAIQVLVWKI